MRTGDELATDVRRAQEELGQGDPADALELVEPLLTETAEAVRSPEFLGRSAPDRQLVLEAFCYARITATLALEAVGAAEAVPRIRRLASEALDLASWGGDVWKVLCAASEMLARSGDPDGAAWAVNAASRLAPDEEYVTQVRGSVRSMYPSAF